MGVTGVFGAAWKLKHSVTCGGCGKVFGFAFDDDLQPLRPPPLAEQVKRVLAQPIGKPA